MTPEEKQLLLRDLCARLPYGVICRLSVKGVDVFITEKLECGGLDHFIYGTMDVKPYLRPMSNMTEEEAEIYNDFVNRLSDYDCQTEQVVNEMNDWLLSNHFDFRGLIPKGLALVALEGMYKTE